MNIAKLNTVSLDDKTLIIKRGTSGGGSTPDTPTKPKYTGHADAEGLKAIGWTDDDIAYYQENGVNWNEEDDQWHKVSDDNKALYGVLTADNIQTYKDRIVYLPKIDTSGKTSMKSMFENCYSLTAIPILDTSKVTSMTRMFYYCYSLTAIPMLDTSNVEDMSGIFSNCSALTSIPMLDTGNVIAFSNAFIGCCSLTTLPLLNLRNVASTCSMCKNCYSLTTVYLPDMPNNEDTSSMFNGCYSLTHIQIGKTSENLYSINQMLSNCRSLKYFSMIDFSSIEDVYNAFTNCYSLVYIYLKNVNIDISLNKATLLTKDSLLYLINNEAATSAITIKLASYAYDRWATDTDVVAALANHPNISLAK